MNDIKREDGGEKAAKGVQASLAVLVRGAEKTFEDAERLFFEAELLAKAGAVARALCLHQISLEECSKVNNLGVSGVSLVLGFEVNQKKVLAAFGRHAAKNKSNAYMLKGSEAETDAKALGDWEAAMEAFRQTQDEFTRRRTRPRMPRFTWTGLTGNSQRQASASPTRCWPRSQGETPSFSAMPKTG